jgi:hypothetical protein
MDFVKKRAGADLLRSGDLRFPGTYLTATVFGRPVSQEVLLTTEVLSAICTHGEALRGGDVGLGRIK